MRERLTMKKRKGAGWGKGMSRLAEEQLCVSRNDPSPALRVLLALSLGDENVSSLKYVVTARGTPTVSWRR